MCDMVGLELSFGDQATCKTVLSQGCSTNPGLAAVNDATACLTALTTSCTSYWETSAHPPTACRNKAGTVADMAACGYNEQCVAGDGCDFTGVTHTDPSCMLGTCTAYALTTESCIMETDCDPRVGDHCVETFVSGTGSSPPKGDGNTVCQNVTYGGNGAACVNATNKQCQTGFNCVANACTPVLGVGTVCDPTTNNNCDPRIELTCAKVPNSTPAVYKCTAPTVVGTGSQCGVVSGVTQICKGNLYCNTSVTPNVCAARVAKDGGCVTSIANECTFGLACAKPTDPMPGTCQVPVPVCQ
jgi:hypothetical protein